MDFRPAFKPSPIVRVMINIGAGLDIPTGLWIVGRMKESILNGGLGAITGVTAIGNGFKSTVAAYMELSAMSKVIVHYNTNMSKYDTEINTHESRLTKLTQRFQIFKDKDILQTGIHNEDPVWIVTSKQEHPGDEWFDITKEYLQKKAKEGKLIDTPFVARDGKTALQIITPTFGDVDSFTDFTSSAENKMLDENSLGESGANTFFMKSGLVKTRLLMELPVLAGAGYHYTVLTAQLGKEIPMNSGPMPAPPNKKLQYLKNGDKIKNVTDKFTFATNNCWHIYNAAPLINQSTKLPEYPDGDEHQSTDLVLLSLRCLRSKSGPSGITLELIASQREGILAELSEFHYIKSMDRFGISGTLQHYALDILPDVKLQRTTVRSKIDSDFKLRRAILITSELCQMTYLTAVNPELLCTPKQLYEDLIKLGYDWDVLLNSRGYWLLNNYDENQLPFLSTMDLLKMRKEVYHPFWLAEDKKTRIPVKFK